MGSINPWLAPFDWEIVRAQNAVLCQAKNALHKPTSDGHETLPRLFGIRGIKQK